MFIPVYVFNIFHNFFSSFDSSEWIKWKGKFNYSDSSTMYESLSYYCNSFPAKPHAPKLPLGGDLRMY